MEPEFGYARATDGAYIAYATLGDGPVDLVWQFDWFGNVDAIFGSPNHVRLFDGLASFSRLILHDRRGTGLSTRNVDVPDLETRVADLTAVLDTLQVDRPVLAAAREGGAPNVMLAASDPERVRSLVWYAPSAKSVWSPDYPWGARPEYVEHDQRDIDVWGTSAYGAAFIEMEGSVGHDIDPREAAALAKLSRNTGTPDVARRMSQVWYETDIRPLLDAVRVPTLLLAFADTEDARLELDYIAARMPDARAVVLPGAESDGRFDPLLSEIRGFLGIDQPPSLDTVLSTVLFTDIVDSTRIQAAEGDARWRELIERHHATVRGLLSDFRGTEQDTAGDGFFARFDGPARAIRCAGAITEAVRPLGIEVRAGVHTGECEVADGKCTGLAVSIGARVAALAGPSEVLVSQTVRDLVAGSGLTFDDAGEHELKGVPGSWRLYRVAGREPARAPIEPATAHMTQADKVFGRLARRAPGAMRTLTRLTYRERTTQ